MGTNAQAIFVSYTTQDAEAVRRLCEALRAAGAEVWFDQDELRGGDAWDASIRHQIRDCALFVPVISAHTEARPEGYFRLEWRLAVERSQLMADDHAYLMPVVIDATNEATARVPDRFRERQWTRLPGGECTPAFVEQVRRTLAAVATGTAAPTTAPVHPPPRPRPRPAWRRHGPVIVALAAALAMATIATGLLSWKRHRVAGPAPPQSAAAATAASAAHDPKSIAVLPFENLTGRHEDAYLADGLQEEVLNALARIRALNVISRTSTAEFRGFTPNVREVGDRLNVGSVLEGSVRREGQKVRLTVQLIDARNDHHILAADYDRDLGHLLGLQSEVARKVADALAAALSNAEHGEFRRIATNSGDAYNFYLRAVALWHQQGDGWGTAASRQLLEQALRLDPDYTDALALLSQACTWSAWITEQESERKCARDNYERALALDPQLPEARLARGAYETYVTRDLDAAIVDLEAVVQRRPNSAEAQEMLGAALRRRGRFDEAIVRLSRAWDVDPLNQYYSVATAMTLLGLRRYPELADQIRLQQRRFPADVTKYFALAEVQCHLQHDLEPLRRALREHGDALAPDDRKWRQEELAQAEGRYLDAAKLLQGESGADRQELRLGFLYWAAGRNAEAQQSFRAFERNAQAELRKSDDYGIRDRLALAQSMLGEHAAALANIDRVRAQVPESHEPLAGPPESFLRSIILVRAGRTAEGYAEVERLLHVPWGAMFTVGYDPIQLAVKDDPHFNEIINNPPRL